jgi:hypothetical protein
MAKAKVDTRVNGNGAASDPAAIHQFGSFLTASTKVFEAWQAIGVELIEFSKARVDQGIEMGSAVARSSSLNEAMELQAKFAQSTLNDILAEARKLAALSTRPILESFAVAQKATHETARTGAQQ